MDSHIWFAYIITAIIFSLAPGSGTVNSISNGINYGVKRSSMAILGLEAGLVFHIVVVGVGLGTLVAHSMLLFNAIKWFGVIYLIWLGVQKWRDRSALFTETNGTKTSSIDDQTNGRTLFSKGFFINLTNPKSIVFLVALFPQFIDPNQSQLLQFIILGLTTIIIDGCVMFGYTTLAAKLRQFIRSDKIMGRVNKCFGTMFIGCAGLLATAKLSLTS